MPTDKQLYDLYLKEMKATGLQVDKKLAAFTDSFAIQIAPLMICVTPNRPIKMRTPTRI